MAGRSADDVWGHSCPATAAQWTLNCHTHVNVDCPRGSVQSRSLCYDGMRYASHRQRHLRRSAMPLGRRLRCLAILLDTSTGADLVSKMCGALIALDAPRHENLPVRLQGPVVTSTPADRRSAPPAPCKGVARILHRRDGGSMRRAHGRPALFGHRRGSVSVPSRPSGSVNCYDLPPGVIDGVMPINRADSVTMPSRRSGS